MILFQGERNKNFDLDALSLIRAYKEISKTLLVLDIYMILCLKYSKEKENSVRMVKDLGASKSNIQYFLNEYSKNGWELSKIEKFVSIAKFYEKIVKIVKGMCKEKASEFK